ncbi:hypothetical protein [Isachenkonia alkalipeptolytica]|uniref:Uncharacterized protein n=1 Tax=Isachenkonia alkalipeptolytica TaxID=2565777 RepID=A0AA43XMZ0_9CLOT|nr:hypothetical protein [Isachenkonia alkalipeptolytica]NBG89665.1 hypothetical protein [Isachenkonia alkalipeptolytica]
MELKSFVEYKQSKESQAKKLQDLSTSIKDKKAEVDRLETEYATTEENSTLKDIQKLRGQIAELETREGILKRKKVTPHEMADKVYEDWKAERSRVEKKAAGLYYEAERILKEAQAQHKKMMQENRSMKLNFAQFVTAEIVRSGCVDDMTIEENLKGNLKTKANNYNF